MTWIKCEDRLPELFEDVLVYVTSELTFSFNKDDKYIGIDRLVKWEESQQISFVTDYYEKGKVTHWHALPKAPKD